MTPHKWKLYLIPNWRDVIYGWTPKKQSHFTQEKLTLNEKIWQRKFHFLMRDRDRIEPDVRRKISQVALLIKQWAWLKCAPSLPACAMHSSFTMTLLHKIVIIIFQSSVLCFVLQTELSIISSIWVILSRYFLSKRKYLCKHNVKLICQKWRNLLRQTQKNIISGLKFSRFPGLNFQRKKKVCKLGTFGLQIHFVRSAN